MDESEYSDELNTSIAVMQIVTGEFSDAINDYNYGYDTKSECLDRISWCLSEVTSEYNHMNSISSPSKYNNIHTHYVNALYYYAQAYDYSYDGIYYDDADYLNTASYYMELGNDEIKKATNELESLQKPATYKPKEADYTWLYAICVLPIIIVAVVFGAVFYTKQKGERERLERLREEQQREREKFYHVAKQPAYQAPETYLQYKKELLTKESQSQEPSYQPSEETFVERRTEPIEPTFPFEEVKPIKVRCPTCKEIIEIKDIGRPLEIVCEKCGTKGTLK